MMYILRSCRRMPVWSCKQLLKDSAQAESKRNQKRKAEPATPDRRSGFRFFVFILSVAAAFGFTGSRVPKPESNVLPKSADISISDFGFARPEARRGNCAGGSPHMAARRAAFASLCRAAEAVSKRAPAVRKTRRSLRKLPPKAVCGKCRLRFGSFMRPYASTPAAPVNLNPANALPAAPKAACGKRRASVRKTA